MKRVKITALAVVVLVLTVCARGAIVRAEQSPAPRIVFLVNDEPDNYEAARTIPAFAQMLDEKHGCRSTVIQGQGKLEQIHFPGLEKAIENADLLVIFFRRSALSKEQLAAVRSYLDSGRPLVGIRTANHAFSVKAKPAKGHAMWWDFVPEVLGCMNRGYGSEKAGAEVTIAPGANDDPILAGFWPARWHAKGSLYLVAPMVDKKAKILLTGRSGKKTEPVAWTRKYKNSRVFYTSLGFPDDFQQPHFQRLLVNGIFWALDRPAPGATVAD